MSVFHPDLASGRFIPKFSWNASVARVLGSIDIPLKDPGDGVSAQELIVPGPHGAPQVVLRVFQPEVQSGAMPVMFWIHGGGLISGAPQQDDRTNAAFVRELGITTVSVRYRLAPTSPAPAAVEDAYAGLIGLAAQAGALNLDLDRLAIGGASAGGGIAAALVLMAHDRGVVEPAFQLLIYPMLDDRTITRTDMDTRNARVWTPGSNRYGWTSYLGEAAGGADVSPYAAAARREDLSGLPPAWLGVGTLDLFYDEDLEYARRLTEAAVPTQVDMVPGAFHGFDALYPKAPVSRQFWNLQAAALRRGLGIGPTATSKPS